MTKKSGVPAIRFKGFTDTWEQRKLGECAEFNPKSELPDIFEYVDLESVVGTDILSHRTESKSSAPSRAQRLAQKGDVFYQTVRPYQKNNCIFENDENNWVFSTGYAQLRPVNDGYFLLTLLQNEDFVKLVLDRCTGTSYPAINSNDLADIDVNIPINNLEQQRIGDYFRNLDSLITLHQRKYIHYLLYHFSTKNAIIFDEFFLLPIPFYHISRSEFAQLQKIPGKFRGFLIIQIFLHTSPTCGNRQYSSFFRECGESS